MSCKSILVYLNDTQRAGRLLDVAMPLAAANGAHLIGLAVMPPYVIIPAYESAGTSVTVDDHRVAYQAELVKLKTKFEEAGRKQGGSVEWREADATFGSAAQVVVQHARSVDLVVISQDNADWTYNSFLEDMARIVVEAGRPVIVVPNTGRTTAPPKRVLIAWNGRREAARAAFDAAQILPAGAEVTVLWVDSSADRVETGEVAGVDLAAALTRYGLKCEAATVRAGDGGAGQTILAEATARGVDLVVMGAYGHTRMREFVLGGASRAALVGMDRPILMSH